MPFNSIPFLIFFILVLLLFQLVKSEHKIYLLAFSSLFFYCFINLFNLLVLLIVILIVFIFSKRYSGSNNGAAVAIVLIAFILIVSKVLLSVNLYGNQENNLISFGLAVGLSFYSLQAIAYILDVRDGKIPAEKKIIKLVSFLSFFPQALAGPIHRFSELMPQFDNLKLSTFVNLNKGIKMILWGYFCKLIIADKIALIINPILSNPGSKNGLSLFIASLLYSFQIYFDFYGYTLVAIGIALMFGISLNENFNNPYSATSFKDFWRRWHITLSKWLRDYVYLRLGGRNNSYVKFCVVVAFTFFISGLWHGLTPNYLIWGVMHAFFYLLEDLFSNLKLSANVSKFQIILWAKRLLFFILITFSWIVFRTTDLTKVRTIFSKILTVSEWSILGLTDYTQSIYSVFLLLIVIILLLNLNKWVKSIVNKAGVSFQDRSLEALYIVCCALLLVVFGDLGAQQFLYFKF